MNRQPARLSEVLDLVLRSVGLGDPAVFQRIQSEWAELAGDPWSRLSTPVALARRTLVVETESPAAVSMLRYGSLGLIQRLNQALGADRIGEIKVRAARGEG